MDSQLNDDNLFLYILYINYGECRVLKLKSWTNINIKRIIIIIIITFKSIFNVGLRKWISFITTIVKNNMITIIDLNLDSQT